MKKYSVDYDPHVIKKLNKFDTSVRNRIITWIDKNLVDCENPRRLGKSLHGEWHDFWRYRVGEYRIIAKIEEDKIIIFVVKIDKRGAIYD